MELHNSKSISAEDRNRADLEVWKEMWKIHRYSKKYTLWVPLQSDTLAQHVFGELKMELFTFSLLKHLLICITLHYITFCHPHQPLLDFIKLSGNIKVSDSKWKKYQAHSFFRNFFKMFSCWISHSDNKKFVCSNSPWYVLKPVISWDTCWLLIGQPC